MAGPDTEARPARGGPWTAVTVGLATLAVALATLAWASAFHVQDDAYMFVRYADRFLAEGTFAWNPGGAPTYGATSLGYLFFVTAFRAAIPGQSAVGIAACSAWMAASRRPSELRTMTGSRPSSGPVSGFSGGWLRSRSSPAPRARSSAAGFSQTPNRFRKSA